MDDDTFVSYMRRKAIQSGSSSQLRNTKDMLSELSQSKSLLKQEEEINALNSLVEELDSERWKPEDEHELDKSIAHPIEMVLSATGPVPDSASTTEAVPILSSNHTIYAASETTRGTTGHDSDRQQQHSGPSPDAVKSDPVKEKMFPSLDGPKGSFCRVVVNKSGMTDHFYGKGSIACTCDTYMRRGTCRETRFFSLLSSMGYPEESSAPPLFLGWDSVTKQIREKWKDVQAARRSTDDKFGKINHGVQLQQPPSIDPYHKL